MMNSVLDFMTWRSASLVLQLWMLQCRSVFQG